MAFPQRVSWQHYQGDNFDRIIRIRQPDGTTPIDLSGAEVAFSLSAPHPQGKEDRTWRWTQADPYISVDPGAGQVSLDLPRIVTVLWSQGKTLNLREGVPDTWFIDFTVTFSDGRVKTYLYGTLDVQPEVVKE